MAVPFGGYPTFGQYQVWARKQGCQVEYGVNYNDDGQAFRITKIVAPSGKWVIDVGTQDSDYLVPTTIGRFDRRLGLKSEFFSIDMETGVADDPS